MRRVICVTLILCLLSPAPVSAAEIVLRNGRVLNGEVVKADGSGLTVKFLGSDVPTDVWDTGELDGCAGARWSGNFDRKLTIPWQCLAEEPPDSVKALVVTKENSPDDAGEMLECDSQGRAEAGHLSTGGSFTGGFVGGLFLGIIGAGIAVVVQSTPEPTYQQIEKLEGDDCRYAYAQAFRGKGKSEKQSAALSGGLAGTAILVLAIVIANSGSE